MPLPGQPEQQQPDANTVAMGVDQNGEGNQPDVAVAPPSPASEKPRNLFDLLFGGNKAQHQPQNTGIY